MPAKPVQPIEFDVSILNQIACPACQGDLRLGDLRLVCVNCARAYSIVDGIPVLIVERAKIFRESVKLPRPATGVSKHQLAD